MEIYIKKAIFVDIANELTLLGNGLDLFTRRICSIAKPVAAENMEFQERLELLSLYMERMKREAFSASNHIINCDGSDNRLVCEIRSFCKENFIPPGHTEGRPFVGDNESLRLDGKN